MIRKFIFTLLALLSFGLLQSQIWNVFPDTTRNCQTDSLLLEIEDLFDHYTWNTSPVDTNFIWVKENGTYSVILEGGPLIEPKYDTTYVSIFPVNIVQNDTSILCGDTIVLNVDSLQYEYLWEPGDLTGNPVEVSPRDTTIYTVTITDPVNPALWCVDTISISTESQIFVDSIIQLEMGCKDEPRGKMDIDISGEFPSFTYEWSSGYPLPNDSSIVEYIVDGDHEVIITDSIGCRLIEEFTVEPYPMPEIQFLFDPDSVVFFNKPYITFSFENLSYEETLSDTFALITYTWDFGDDSTSNLANPTHTFLEKKDFTIKLNYKTYFGCEGTDTTQITIDLKIPRVPDIITPNGDDYNQYLVIQDDGTEPDENGEGDQNPPPDGHKWGDVESPEMLLEQHYISYDLVIFNRWGHEVYQSTNYQNDWDGSGLPDGVYFYVLQCNGHYGSEVFKGTVTILR